MRVRGERGEGITFTLHCRVVSLSSMILGGSAKLLGLRSCSLQRLVDRLECAGETEMPLSSSSYNGQGCSTARSER